MTDQPEYQNDARLTLVADRAKPTCFCYHPAHLRKVSGDLCLDEQCAVLIGAKGHHLLTKSQKAIFCTLLEASGCPVSADRLAARLAGASREVPLTKTVRNSVCLLRRRLAQLSSSVRIETRYGYGYWLRIDRDLTPPR